MTAAVSGLRRPYDTLRRVIGPLASPVYGAVVALRNRRFDSGTGVKRIQVPVVSIGNLTVGGTGKTPFVMWLCRQLTARGLKPAIAMRGYKAESSGGRSDEAEEYRAALPGVPVIVNPDRHAGITAFLAQGGRTDVVVLDDGFQHRRLHRDLDVVLVDAQAGTPSDRLLPSGDLREPVSSVARAGVVVLTHAEHAEAADRSERLLQPMLAPGALVVRAQHRWSDLDVNDAGVDTTWRVNWLRGKRVIALCGVARPSGFLQALKDLGCLMPSVLVLRDHQPIDAEVAGSVARLAEKEKARIIVTTGKDFARMGVVPPAWAALTVVRPRLMLDVQPSDAVLARVMHAIRARGSGGAAG